MIKARIELRLRIKKAEHLLDILIKIPLQAIHQIPSRDEKINHLAHGEWFGGGAGGGLLKRIALILVHDSVVDALAHESSIKDRHIVGRGRYAKALTGIGFLAAALVIILLLYRSSNPSCWKVFANACEADVWDLFKGTRPHIGDGYKLFNVQPALFDIIKELA